MKYSHLIEELHNLGELLVYPVDAGVAQDVIRALVLDLQAEFEPIGAKERLSSDAVLAVHPPGWAEELAKAEEYRSAAYQDQTRAIEAYEEGEESSDRALDEVIAALGERARDGEAPGESVSRLIAEFDAERQATFGTLVKTSPQLVVDLGLRALK